MPDKSRGSNTMYKMEIVEALAHPMLINDEQMPRVFLAIPKVAPRSFVFSVT